MKSPTSIVNTLLESGYADYDPNLDPFSDPKNLFNDLSIRTGILNREDIRIPGLDTDSTTKRRNARENWWACMLSSSGFIDEWPASDETEDVKQGLSDASYGVFMGIRSVKIVAVHLSEGDPLHGVFALSRDCVQPSAWTRLMSEIAEPSDSACVHVKVVGAA